MLIGFFNQKSATLNETRQYIINFCFRFAVIISLIMLFVRLFEQRPEMVLIALVSLALSSFFLYLSEKGHNQTILFISNFIYLIVTFYEGLTLNIPVQTVIYFTGIPLIVVFLLESERLRIITLAINMSSFVLLNILSQAEPWSDIFTFLIIITFINFLVLIFIRKLEYQEEILIEALSEKEVMLEKLEEKHEDVLLFNDMMNHDIKAPIRAIKGFTSVLQKSNNTDKKEREYLGFIKKSAENLEKLIFNLLTLTKIDVDKVEKSLINLEDILEVTCWNLTYDINTKNVEIKYDTLPSIYANNELLKTVLQNVISNGIKYQPKSEAHQPQINIYYKSDKNLDKIYIQDNGIGIKTNNLDKLFTPFLRFHSASEYEGTGLGMTICKRIMNKHHGDIRYINNDKNGACFELSFPKKNS